MSVLVTVYYRSDPDVAQVVSLEEAEELKESGLLRIPPKKAKDSLGVEDVYGADYVQ